ncbi:MAG TPA: polysaccharide biosynthesis/export family protein [Sphingomonas sp.]
MAAIACAGVALAQSAFPTGTGAAMSAPAPIISGASADYKIGAGDLLTISVYRSPDLQSSVRVGTDGAITFPALGNVTVAGLTADGIADKLASGLKKRGILVAPSVNVLVAEVRSKVVMVMGAVGRPGEVPLDRPGLSLAAVLARAGAAFGTGSGIVTVKGGQSDAAASEQFRISDLVSGARDRDARPGEILVVESAPTIYVSGEVGRPGAYPLEPGMTVGQAVALGGGITPRGSKGRIRVTHKAPDGTATEAKKVNFDTPVQPNDLIYVGQRLF